MCGGMCTLGVSVCCMCEYDGVVESEFIGILGFLSLKFVQKML